MGYFRRVIDHCAGGGQGPRQGPTWGLPGTMPDGFQMCFYDSLGMFEPIFTDFGFFRFRIPPSYPQNFSEISMKKFPKIWAPERGLSGAPERGVNKST